MKLTLKYGVVALLLVMLGAALIIYQTPHLLSAYVDDDETYYEEMVIEDDFATDSTCSVARIEVVGPMGTTFFDGFAVSSEIVTLLETAEDSDHIKAIVIEIDTPGGAPVAAEEISTAMKRYVTKPIVAQIRSMGTSAGYWIASAADVIFASELSDIGSIGVTQSYVDAAKYNEKEGYTFNRLSKGAFKDYLNPEKPLTDEEKKLIERDLDLIYGAFIREVAENRGMTIESVIALADGSSMLGRMALEKGLIDKIGGHYDVLDYFETTLGVEDIKACY